MHARLVCPSHVALTSSGQLDPVRKHLSILHYVRVDAEFDDEGYFHHILPHITPQIEVEIMEGYVVRQGRGLTRLNTAIEKSGVSSFAAA
jgi:hypothetical protein